MRKAFRSGKLLAVAFATYFAAGCGSAIVDRAPPQGSNKAIEGPSELRLADVQLRVGRTAFDQGSLGTALELFEKAHRSAPNDARPLVGKGDVLFAQRRFGEAETAYRGAVERDSGSYEAQEGLGKTLVSTRRYREGLRAFEAALAVRRDAGLLNKIGVTHEMLGDGDSAQKYYRESLALESDDLTARNNLALSLGVSGSYDAALKEMEKVVASPKASDRHHANLAFIYGLSGRSMDQVPPRIANAAASKGWDDAFFVRTREVAKSGDRTALLDLLNNRRPSVSPSSQLPPMAALPEMPESEPETPETAKKPVEAPMTAGRPDPAPAMSTAPEAAMAALPPAPEAPAEPGAPKAESASPTALVPPPPAPESAPSAAESAPAEARMAAIPAEPAADPESRPVADPVAADVPEAPAAQPHSAQMAMRTPVNSGVDDPDSLGLEAPAATARSAGPAAPEASDGAYRVELGAFRTAKWLSATLAKLGATAGDLLPGKRLDVRHRKDLYMVRSDGLPTRDAAAQLCADLRARAFDCFVTGKPSTAGRTFDIAMAGDPEAVRAFIAGLPGIDQTVAPPAAPTEAPVPAAPAAPEAGPGMAPGPDAGMDSRPEQGADATGTHAMVASAGPAMAPNAGDSMAAPASATAAPLAPVEPPAIVPPPPPPPSDIVAAIRESETGATGGSPMLPAAAPQAETPQAASPPAMDATAAASPGSGEYRVQLAAYRLARHLARGKAVLEKAAGGLLPPLEGLTRAETQTATAIPFRLRSAPLDSRAAAVEVCRKLTEKGVECLVIRHGAEYWRPLS